MVDGDVLFGGVRRRLGGGLSFVGVGLVFSAVVVAGRLWVVVGVERHAVVVIGSVVGLWCGGRLKK
jgi:hypothetical protein